MKREKSSGQVVVEMLLILPIFLTMVFCIMEIGYISFQVILLNHATYEVARIGGMTFANPPSYACGNLGGIMAQILPRARVSCSTEKTLDDPQSEAPSFDLIVTGIHPVKLVFPISSIILAKPRGSGGRELTATVRMPIETPLKK